MATVNQALAPMLAASLSVCALQSRSCVGSKQCIVLRYNHNFRSVAVRRSAYPYFLGLLVLPRTNGERPTTVSHAFRSIVISLLRSRQRRHRGPFTTCFSS